MEARDEISFIDAPSPARFAPECGATSRTQAPRGGLMVAQLGNHSAPAGAQPAGRAGRAELADDDDDDGAEAHDDDDGALRRTKFFLIFFTLTP
jgi:hypothetical protein